MENEIYGNETTENIVSSSFDVIPNQKDNGTNFATETQEINPDFINNEVPINNEETLKKGKKKEKKKIFSKVESEGLENKVDASDVYVKDYEKYKGLGRRKEKKHKISKSKLKQLEKEKAIFLEDLKKEGATRQEVPTLYLFKVVESNGKITTGTMTGLSKLDINAFLVSEGYEVISIKSSSWISFAYKDTSIFGTSKMKTKDLVFFLTQLHTYLKAGLTLSKSIDILSKQLKKSDGKRTAFRAISFELSLGENFSDALAKQGDMFPALLINMIKAAEASGSLNETLNDLVVYYTQIDAAHKQMKSALTYPIVVLLFSIAVIIFVLIYVIPEFSSIYSTGDTEVGALTQTILTVSDFLTNYVLYIILAVVVVIIIFVIMYKKIKFIKTHVQIFTMKVPIFKDVIIFNELTVFSKTFASLLRNNVYITDSVDILTKITNNEIYKGILFKTISNIVKGENISEAFKNHWAVPDVAYFMIVTGESTGELSNMMQRVSDYYQEMHKSLVNNLKSLLEPALTCFLAVIVGLILIAVIVPMYDSMGSMLG